MYPIANMALTQGATTIDADSYRQQAMAQHATLLEAGVTAAQAYIKARHISDLHPRCSDTYRIGHLSVLLEIDGKHWSVIVMRGPERLACVSTTIAIDGVPDVASIDFTRAEAEFEAIIVAIGLAGQGNVVALPAPAEEQ